MPRSLMPLISPKDLLGPHHCIFNAYARRLRLDPEFQVVNIVLVTHAIPVVHRFVWIQRPTKISFHDNKMF